MSYEQPEPASEVVHLVGPSWAPPMLAVGLTLALIGIFAGWVYSAIGGIAILIALWLWFRQYGDENARLPREQAVDTAVLPPSTTRRANGR